MNPSMQGAAQRKFEVVMLATPEIDYYAQRTSADWRIYCERHGYEFFLQRASLAPDLHIVWSKVELVRQRMQSSREDWIVLVDADTLVNRPELALDSILARYPGKELLVSEDCSRRFGAPFPLSFAGPRRSGAWRAANTGFLMAKRGVFCAELFTEWMSHARGPGAAAAAVFPREQGVFWDVFQRRADDRIAILGSEVMRVGVAPLLDPWTVNSRRAFVLHDKRLTNYESR